MSDGRPGAERVKAALAAIHDRSEDVTTGMSIIATGAWHLRRGHHLSEARAMFAISWRDFSSKWIANINIDRKLLSASDGLWAIFVKSLHDLGEGSRVWKS